MVNIKCISRSIINVPANIDKTQSVLPRLLEDDGTIGVLLKWCLIYKSPFMSENVRPNMIILALKDLLNTQMENDISEDDVINQTKFKEET